MTAAEQPAITALAPWFGGKRNLAATITAELGDHRVYWEPFCGGLAILGAKPPCVMETVGDLHGDLTNLAWIIQDRIEGPRLYRRLRRVLMAEPLFDISGDVIREEEPPALPDGERAFHYFITAWFGRNGVAGTNNYNAHYCARYTANGGHAAKRWQSAVRSIPWWRRRLRNVTILRRDAFEVLAKIDDAPGTALYIDPPYLAKAARYAHDPDALPGRWGSLRWHVRLARLLRRFRRARVVVSYYDHPYLPRLYRGWTLRKIDVSKAMSHRGKRGASDVRATEVLLINGPSYVANELSLFPTVVA